MTYRPYNILISQASSGSTGITYDLENASGAPIADMIPVCSEISGGFKKIDVSNETDALSVIGVTKETILNASVGKIAGFGRFENITTSFALNDTLWVSKTGGLTNIVPEVDANDFVSHDFVIMVGKIVKNQTNPSNKDLIVNIKLIGQLE